MPASDIDHAAQDTQSHSPATNAIAEEDDAVANQDAGSGQFRPPGAAITDSQTLYWRIDLAKSEQYWRGWFEGLSAAFLGAPAQAKMLLLAGIDRLDKTLTLGQMQGECELFWKRSHVSCVKYAHNHFSCVITLRNDL